MNNSNNNVGVLGMIGKASETIEQYKDRIANKYLLTEHFNVMMLLKNNEFVKGNLKKKSDKWYKTKWLRNTEHKIIVLRELEEYYNSVCLEGAGTFNNIKLIYDTKQKLPTSQKELK